MRTWRAILDNSESVDNFKTLFSFLLIKSPFLETQAKLEC